MHRDLLTLHSVVILYSYLKKLYFFVSIFVSCNIVIYCMQSCAAVIWKQQANVRVLYQPTQSIQTNTGLVSIGSVPPTVTLKWFLPVYIP